MKPISTSGLEFKESSSEEEDSRLRPLCKSIDFVLQFLYIYYNTLVSYKEEASLSVVEDVLNHILERLDDIFESKSLIS